ncbi:DNA polymerase I [Ureibacillus massiliensis 4400831 = CIP 108448 = CCUG 49529]|uniref:DNA polymerase I n=1 Tax=Ureibacillus massiliensis 4400831 = CIP 108448 = CCUG 49529 TaxID=1211035 RepID=A0A0A3J6S6_9BACL|nr:DNA polymerase I [Ureibacillus massiliensis 4400831 = CIP 108448 = CCUG 49529]
MRGFLLQTFNKYFQNCLVAIMMACSVTALFSSTSFTWLKIEIFHIPILFIFILSLSLFISEEVRNSFKKVLKFDKREDKRPIWQVGVGMIFFFVQVGLIEVFFRSLMGYDLGGMPLYIVFAFMNAFLATVIYEEIFYEKNEIHHA